MKLSLCGSPTFSLNMSRSASSRPSVRTGKTKQGKTGPSVRYAVRRADVLQLRTHGQLVQALDRLEGGRLQSLGFARAVARTLKPFNPALTQRQVLEATITDEEKDTGVDVLTNPKERAEKLRAWVAKRGRPIRRSGRLDAETRAGFGRPKEAERALRTDCPSTLLPPSRSKAPPPLSRLESKFKGGTIGSIALVKAALSALGYNANRVNRAIRRASFAHAADVTQGSSLSQRVLRSGL